MAIQNRRGNASEFNAYKPRLQQGEFAVVTDGDASPSGTGVYMQFGAVGTTNKIKRLITDDEDTTSVVASPYDTSKSYKVGDHCTYNKVLYVCTATTSGTWDSSKWSEVTVGSEVERIRIDLDNTIAKLNAIDAFPYRGTVDDYDKATSLGRYYAPSTASHKPGTVQAWFITLPFGVTGANKFQMCFNAANTLYLRFYNGASWTNWRTI